MTHVIELGAFVVLREFRSHLFLHSHFTEEEIVSRDKIACF